MSQEVAFAPALKADTDEYVRSLYKWISSIVDDEKSAKDDRLQVQEDFVIKKRGNEKDYKTPCGKPVAHNAFRALEPYLRTPEKAYLHSKAMKKVLWHPSDECLHRDQTLEVDGGAFAQFNVTCGDSSDVLIEAMVGSLSVDRPTTGLNDDIVIVQVEFLNSQGYVSDVKQHSKANGVKHKHSEVTSNILMDQVKERIRTCADSKDLLVKGIVGGGWRRLYEEGGNETSSNNHTVTASLIAYLDAFSFSYDQSSSNEPDSDSGEHDLLETTNNQIVESFGEVVDQDPFWQANVNLQTHCNIDSARNKCFIPHFLQNLGVAHLDAWSIAEPKSKSESISLLNVGLCLVLLVVVGVAYGFRRTRRSGYRSLSYV